MRETETTAMCLHEIDQVATPNKTRTARELPPTPMLDPRVGHVMNYHAVWRYTTAVLTPNVVPAQRQLLQ